MAQSPPNAERDLSMVGGHRDIAKTISLERMKVQAKGRQPFQQVYLWTPSINEDGSGGNPLKRKRATTLRYDPSVDGPNSMPCPSLPGDEELLPHDDAKLYLEVGLIIGDEPDRYKPTGLARSKSRQEAMEDRGVMRRDDSAMRVFIPVSDYIAPQAKFYVGCRPYHGRLFPKVVEAACIFFYPDFWAAVDDTQPAKKRLVDMTKECKYRAAVNKTVAGADNEADNEAGNEAGNALANTATPNDGTSELTSSLPDLPIIQDKPNADVERAPSRNILSDENVTSFMNFAEAMTIERCAMIAEELKVSTASLHDLKPDKVKAVHESLRSKVEGKDQKGGLMVDKLSRDGLGFFIEMCHGIISDKDSQKKVARKIKYALIASEIHVHHTSITQTTSESKQTSEISGDRESKMNGVEFCKFQVLGKKR